MIKSILIHSDFKGGFSLTKHLFLVSSCHFPCSLNHRIGSCDLINKFQEVWDNRISLKENLIKMGVSVDANNVVPKISTKGKLIRDMKVRKGVLKEEEVQGARKEHEVIGRLTKEAEFVAKQTFRFTPTQVRL